MHIGNYFGAVRNYVDLQASYRCFYGVADYHSMTMPYDAAKLLDNTWKMVFYLLSVGVKEENVFIQSLVPEHAELTWVLCCMASYGDLTRMTQFREKVAQLQEKDKDAFVSNGIFTYPVLQAADILMYRAEFVPVGKDQEQHLELSRTIASRFNNQFGKDFFVLPQPLFTEIPKLLSTADPTRKMSKSLGEKHYINLFGEEAAMRKQIRSAVTDTGGEAAGEMSAGVKNLFEILKACGGMEAHASLTEDFKNGALRYSDLKTVVADALVDFTNPFRERLAELNADKKAVKTRIHESSAEIRKRAQETMREVRQLTGLPTLR